MREFKIELVPKDLSLGKKLFSSLEFTYLNHNHNSFIPRATSNDQLSFLVN